MKILQVGKSWFPEDPGGLDRYFYDCVRHFPQVGITPYGLVAGSMKVEVESNGFVKSFAPSQSSLFTRWRGLRTSVHGILAKEKISLCVSHFSLYNFPILDQLVNIPLVIHFHGPWALESRSEGNRLISVQLKLWLEQICYRKAVSFIVLSEAFKKILHQNYRVPLDRIQVIPGGVDFEHFQTELSQNEARNDLSWRHDRPTIFALRRLAKRMGLENLIGAIAEVKPRYPDIMLYIAGKGPLRPTLETLIKELGLEENVSLLGFVSDEQLPVMYRAADFSIVPTVALEGFGLILVESLAAGTPVLGTPVGGIPEILNPLNSNLILEGSEPNQIARGIVEVLSGQRWLPDSASCRLYAESNYAWPVIAQKLKIIYTEALKKS